MKSLFYFTLLPLCPPMLQTGKVNKIHLQDSVTPRVLDVI
jgi:hypothetical protein